MRHHARTSQLSQMDEERRKAKAIKLQNKLEKVTKNHEKMLKEGVQAKTKELSQKREAKLIEIKKKEREKKEQKQKAR